VISVPRTDTMFTNPQQPQKCLEGTRSNGKTELRRVRQSEQRMSHRKTPGTRRKTGSSPQGEGSGVSSSQELDMRKNQKKGEPKACSPGRPASAAEKKSLKDCQTGNERLHRGVLNQESAVIHP